MYYLVVFATVWLSIAYFILNLWLSGNNKWLLGSSVKHSRRISLDLNDAERIVLENDVESAHAHNPNCSYWDCFDVYRCGEKLTVYVYPLVDYVQIEHQHKKQGTLNYMSKEFFEILRAIIESPFYTANPKDACIFIPTIDILNLNNIKDSLVVKALASLPQ